MKREISKRKASRNVISSRSKTTTQKTGLSPSRIRSFQQTVYRHYREHGRSFPWRKTRNPYFILVSEIMLQQTQTQRVVGKYKQFITTFPDFAALAHAPLRAILTIWEGLGYNRRAVALKMIAQIVMTQFKGKLPRDPQMLMTLPGIGKATASAICAFAFNQPVVFVETNIRSVFIHFFFRDKNHVRDAEILPLVEATLDTSNPREWYYALMDFGVMLKKTGQNPNRQSTHYQKQSPFRGSNRQLRGMIIKAVIAEPGLSEHEIAERLDIRQERVKKTLAQLRKEGLITIRRNRVTVA